MDENVGSIPISPTLWNYYSTSLSSIPRTQGAMRVSDTFKRGFDSPVCDSQRLRRVTMSTAYISFAHLKSESADDYYLALEGHYSIGDMHDCEQVKEIASALTGEDEDCLYIVCLNSVSAGMAGETLL